MLNALARCSSTFELVAIRAVPRAVGRPSRARELLCEEAAGADGHLHVLELDSLTPTTVPFSRLAPQGTPDELADVAALAAALDERLVFDVHRQPPARTPDTDAARLACGPRWLWAQPPGKLAPCTTATPAELERALALLPTEDENGGLASIDDAAALRGASGLVDVHQFAARLEGRHAPTGGALSVREWRAAAKRLGAPSRRSPTRTELLSTVIGYQVAEVRASDTGFVI